MAKEALDETYSTITEEQRNEFVDLFSTIVRDQSLNKLDIYRAKVTYTNISANGDEARVETLAELDDVRTPVNYEMKNKDGEWVITDMEIDDVSTAGSYNRQFQRIINQKGFDSLMNSLRKRADRA
ncbi:MAG: ABC transporter substrate-binding protein [Gracilimonas sp.]|nr:ABC transporter substrate-binding protein [Gracilimonas sp.]